MLLVMDYHHLLKLCQSLFSKCCATLTIANHVSVNLSMLNTVQDTISARMNQQQSNQHARLPVTFFISQHLFIISYASQHYGIMAFIAFPFMHHHLGCICDNRQSICQRVWQPTRVPCCLVTYLRTLQRAPHLSGDPSRMANNFQGS